jgi:hypothetical protein
VRVKDEAMQETNRKQWISFTGSHDVRRMLSSGMLHHEALVRAGVYRLHRQGDKNRWGGNVNSVFQLLVIATVIPGSPILVTLVMEAIRFSKTLVLTRATWHNIPVDCICHSNCRENLKSYIALYCSRQIIQEGLDCPCLSVCLITESIKVQFKYISKGSCY